MARDIPVGSRLRARRLDLGIAQADLARKLEISPSYLNLIEHNRRRIGGSLLSRAARALDTDEVVLSRGAGHGVVEALRAAAGLRAETQHTLGMRAPDGIGADGTGSERLKGDTVAADKTERAGARLIDTAEIEAAEDFAGRYPGWARLVAAQDRRIAALERTAELLSDRLTHDPYLSAAIHDVLSVVTAIQSTAAILADEPDISAEWRARFHRNLHDDSRRLAEGSQGLVDYLESEGEAENAGAAPQQELERWLGVRDYHLTELEDAGDAVESRIEQLARAPDAFATEVGRSLGIAWMRRYAEDASRLPLSALRAALAGQGDEPGRVARALGLPLALVLRRLACLPEGMGGRPTGLVICDGAGAMLLRKPVTGFSVPRFGAGCALWPLYQVLLEPAGSLLRNIEQAGRMPARFTAFAAAETRRTGIFEGPIVAEAVMLVIPREGASQAGRDDIRVGASCRVCQRGDCPARREPSILGHDRGTG